MVTQEIIRRRLLNQQIARPGFTHPAEVVAALGAVQAQDYLGALWAIGLRLPGATEVEVEQAITAGAIVRTWPMRGTLHFVPAADVRWILELLAPRIIAGSARRRQQLELDDAVFARSREAAVDALQGGMRLTRDQLYGVFERARVSTAGQRGYHILWRLAHDGLICFGPRLGKQQTLVLLDEWVPRAPSLDRDEALATLALRYFAGHGPAALPDFVWWSGLKVADARSAVAMVSSQLVREDVEGASYWMVQGARVSDGVLGSPGLGSAPVDTLAGVHLLPGFDEYLVGYRDRVALLDPRHSPRVVPGGGGMLLPTIVADGRVVGTWKRTLEKDAVVVAANPFGALSRAQKRGLADAAKRYGRFLGLSTELRLEKPSD